MRTSFIGCEISGARGATQATSDDSLVDFRLLEMAGVRAYEYIQVCR